jgi:hypothetical protein
LAYVIAANNAILRLGGGRWFYETAITIPTLSTSGERYAILVGFIESTFSNLVVWCYDEGAIFGNGATYWQTVTVDAASPTRNSNHTQTTVAVDTWYRLGIEVNAAASEVKFYLNGTLQGTHTATIPSGTTEGMGFGTLIYKTVGNTPRTMDIDYILVCVDLTTAR